MPTAGKPPYIEKAEERGKFQVWVVDGSYIRTHQDEEFTNFGQHYRYPYIPVDEFWIDREAGSGELKFFVEHLLVEHRLMARGMPYNKALEAADRTERKERRLAGDLKRLTANGHKLPDGHDVHKRLWKNSRAASPSGSSAGGSSAACSTLISPPAGTISCTNSSRSNEVWIDDDIEEQERGYVLAARASRAQPHVAGHALQQGARRIEPHRIPLPPAPRRTARRAWGGRMDVILLPIAERRLVRRSPSAAEGAKADCRMNIR